MWLPILSRCLMLLMVLACCGLAEAADDMASAVESSINTKQPINVYSDQLTVQPNKNRAHFEKNVKVEQGEATLTSESMMIFYDEGAENQIRLIEMERGVKLVLPDRSVEADEGRYDTKAGTMTLSGNVKMQRGKSTIKGTEFLYDSTTKKSLLKGHKISNINKPKAVEAVMIPTPTLEVATQEVIGPVPATPAQLAAIEAAAAEKSKSSFNPLKAIGRFIGSIFEK